MAKIVVDFAPKVSMTGDLTLVTDHERARVNVVVNNLLRLLRMDRGSMKLFPEHGLMEDLMQLFYNDDPEQAVRALATKASAQLGYQIEGNLTYDEGTNKSSGKIEFVFTDLPGTFRADITENSGFARILNPQLVL